MYILLKICFNNEGAEYIEAPLSVSEDMELLTKWAQANEGGVILNKVLRPNQYLKSYCSENKIDYYSVRSFCEIDEIDLV